SLAAAIRGGFDTTGVDQLTWRYAQVSAIKPSAWWQAPVAEHAKLDKLGQLQADLQAQVQQQGSDSRAAAQRQLRRWNQLLAEARNAGVAADGMDGGTVRYVNRAAISTTPNELMALATVLSQQYTILDGQMAAFRTARAQVDAAAQAARTLLASAAQYPQLNLTGFNAQITPPPASVTSVHSAEAFSPILGQLQQTAVGIQALLDARAAAYNQLADTRSTLAPAQSIGALV